MRVHVLILGNIAPLSGCEFKNSKALEMIAKSREFALFTTRLYMYVPPLCYIRGSACAPHSLISTFVSRTKHYTFCRARWLDLDPNCLLKLACHSLFGGRPHTGFGTTNNSISLRQRDRVMVHGHGLRSKKPTIRPHVVVVLRLG